MPKRALIIGVAGQDGAYLAQLLLNHGYEVTGTSRGAPATNMARLVELDIQKSVKLAALDLLEFSEVLRFIETTRPDEVYNFASQSNVGLSFEQPVYTGEVNA